MKVPMCSTGLHPFQDCSPAYLDTVQTLPSRAGELYGIKETAYDSLWALPVGFKDPKRTKMTKVLTCFYFVCFKVDELVYHTCTISME